MFISEGILHVLMSSFKRIDTVAREKKINLSHHQAKARNGGRMGVDCECADNSVTDGFLHFMLRCGVREQRRAA